MGTIENHAIDTINSIIARYNSIPDTDTTFSATHDGTPIMYTLTIKTEMIVPGHEPEVATLDMPVTKKIHEAIAEEVLSMLAQTNEKDGE